MRIVHTPLVITIGTSGIPILYIRDSFQAFLLLRTLSFASEFIQIYIGY